jgi:ribonuclease HI
MRLRGLHRYIGVTTNNVAEYRALIEGLKAVEPWKPDRLEVYLDSKLVVEQVNDKWRVKNPELEKLIREVRELKSRFSEVEFKHIQREKNRGADALANTAIDEHVRKVGTGG